MPCRVHSLKCWCNTTQPAGDVYCQTGPLAGAPLPCRCVEVNPNGEPLFKVSAARLLENWGRDRQPGTALGGVSLQPQHYSHGPYQRRDQDNRTAGEQESWTLPSQPQEQDQDSGTRIAEQRGDQDSRTAEQQDSRTAGQQDCRTAGQQDSRIPGQQDSRIPGQQDSRMLSSQPLERHGANASPAGAACPKPSSIEYIVAAAGSQPDAFLQGADVVIVDPPRKVRP